jgi:hypothetical protein
VIASRTTPSVLPPACTISGVATANPLRTRLARSPTVKPCARRIGSVHPFPVRRAGEHLQRADLLAGEAP